MKCLIKRLDISTGNGSLPLLSKIGSVYNITGNDVEWKYGYYNEYNGIYTDTGEKNYICTSENEILKMKAGCHIEMENVNYSFFWNFFDVNGNPITRDASISNVTSITFTKEQIPDVYYISISLRRQDRGVISRDEFGSILKSLHITYKA